MADHIVREAFSAAKHIPELANFDCGGHDYQIAVSDWIKAIHPDDSVLTDISRFGTKVWVYYNQAGDVVGFASLGLTNWSLWPPSQKRKAPVVIIPKYRGGKTVLGYSAERSVRGSNYGRYRRRGIAICSAAPRPGAVRAS